MHKELKRFVFLLFCLIFLSTVFASPSVIFHSPQDSDIFNYNTILVNFTVANATSYTVSFGGDFSDSFTDQNYFNNTILGDGIRIITVNATNSTSGISNIFTASFTVDTQPPEVNITAPLNKTYYITNLTQDNISFELFANDNVRLHTFWYTLGIVGGASIDDDSLQMQTNTSYTWIFNRSFVSPSNQYNLTVSTNDTVGLDDSQTVIFTVIQDDTPPIFNITSPKNNSYFNIFTIPILFSINDSESNVKSFSFQTSVGSDVLTNNTNETTVAYEIDGQKNITFFAENNAGLKTNLTHYFTIDTTKPTITVFSPENNTFSTAYNDTNVTLNISANDLNGVNKLYYYLNNNQSDRYNFTVSDGFVINQSESNVTKWSEFTDEEFTLITFVAIDVANNTFTNSVNFSVIDPSVGHPNITIIKPENLVNSSSVDFQINVSDKSGIDKVIWLSGNLSIAPSPFCEGNELKTKLCDIILSSVSDGFYSETFQVNDSFGKISNATVNFTVDTTPPAIDILFPVDAQEYNTTILNINMSLFDEVSIKNASLYINGVLNQTNESIGNFTNPVEQVYWNITDFDFTVFDKEVVNITVESYDISGNKNTQTISFTPYQPGLNPPNVTILSPNQNVTGNRNITFLFNVTGKGYIDEISYLVKDVHTNNTVISTNTNVVGDEKQELWPNVQTEITQGDGAYTLFVTAVDVFGDEGSQNFTFSIDETPPTVNITSINESQLFNTTQIDINLTFEDMFGVKNATYVIYTPEKNITPENNSISFGESSTEFWNISNVNLSRFDAFPLRINITAYDVNGNKLFAQREFRAYDPNTNEPIITISNPLEKVYKNSTIFLNLTVTDNYQISLVSYTIQNLWNNTNVVANTNILVNDDTYTVNSFPNVFTDGEYQINVTAIDDLNRTSHKLLNFTVDVTKPVVTIHSPNQNQNYTDKTAQNINITIFDDFNLTNVTVFLNNNLTGKTSITNPILYYNDSIINDTVSFSFTEDFNEFDEELLNISILAYDSNGWLQNKSLFFRVINMSTNKPNIDVISPIQNGFYNTEDISIIINVSDNTLLKSVRIKEDSVALCQNINQQNFSCTNDFSELADGIYTKTFVVRDQFDKSTEETVSFTVDTTKPQITLLDELSQITPVFNTSNVSIIANITDNINISHVWYYFDGNETNTTVNDMAYGSNEFLLNKTYNLTDLMNGLEVMNHNITIYVNDTTNNVYNLSKSFKIELPDTQKPFVEILQPNSTLIFVNSVMMGVNVSDNRNESDLTVECTRVGFGSVDCANSNPIFTGIPEGIHYFQVNATDAAGNWNATTVNVTIDLFDPIITIYNPQNNVNYNETTLLLNFSTSDRFNLSYISYELFYANNNTIIHSQILKNASNISSNLHINDSAIPALYSYTNDSITLANQTSYKVQINVTDTNNRSSTQTLFFGINTDNTAPPILNISGPISEKIYTNANGQLLINFTATDLFVNVSHLWFEIGGVSYVPQDIKPYNISEPDFVVMRTFTQDKKYEIEFFANDTEGLISNELVEFYFDRKAPNITILSPDSIVYTENVTINVTAFSNSVKTGLSDVSRFWATTNKTGEFGPFNSTDNETLIFNLTNLVLNTPYEITLYANDSVNNTNIIKINVTYVQDSIKPNLTVHSPQENEVFNTTKNVLFNISVSDDVSLPQNILRQINLGNGTTLVYNESFNHILANGNYTLNFTATDEAGNINWTSFNITVDFNGMDLIINSPLNITYNTTSIWVNATALDSSSENVSYMWVTNETNDVLGIVQNSSLSQLITFANNKTHTLTFWVNNTLNETISQNRTFSVKINETTPLPSSKPNITVISPLNNSYYGTNQILIEFEADDADTLYFYNTTNNQTYTAPTVINLSDGEYELIFYANNSVGVSSASHEIFINTTPLQYTLFDQPNSTHQNITKLEIPINISYNRNITDASYMIGSTTIDASEFITSDTLLGSVYILEYGVFNITFSAEDRFGFVNQTTVQVNVSLDSQQISQNTEGTIVGNTTNVATNQEDIMIFVNGSDNLTQNTSQNPVSVQIKSSSNTPLVSYSDNLSQSPLNLTRIILQSSQKENKASIFVKGLQLSSGVTKSLFINLTGDLTKHNSICIKDASFTSISQFSANCDAANEYYVVLNDSSTIPSQYTITNSSSTLYNISGLTYSGVTQMCTVDWQVGSWGSCSGSTQTRTVVDLNSCGLTTNKPSTTQSCTTSSPGGSPGSGSPGSGSSGSVSIPPPSQSEETDEDVENTTQEESLSNQSTPTPRPQQPPQSETEDETEDEQTDSSILSRIISSFNVLIVLVGIFMIVGIVGATVVISKKSKKTVSKQNQPPISVSLSQDPYPQLTAYMKRELQKGISEKRLREFLLTTEWSKDDIERAFTRIKGTK